MSTATKVHLRAHCAHGDTACADCLERRSRLNAKNAHTRKLRVRQKKFPHGVRVYKLNWPVPGESS